MVHELDVAVAKVKDTYAKKPEPKAAMETMPFYLYSPKKTKSNIPERVYPKVTFNEANLLDNAMNKLSKAV